MGDYFDYEKDQFQRFWDEYPRRKTTPRISGKYNCSLKWIKLLNESDVLTEDIINGVKAYAKSDTVKDGYVKLPMTYLNGRFWMDEEEIDEKSQNEMETIEAFKTPYQARTPEQWAMCFPNGITEMTIRTWRQDIHGPRPTSLDELKMRVA